MFYGRGFENYKKRRFFDEFSQIPDYDSQTTLNGKQKYEDSSLTILIFSARAYLLGSYTLLYRSTPSFNRYRPGWIGNTTMFSPIKVNQLNRGFFSISLATFIIAARNKVLPITIPTTGKATETPATSTAPAEVSAIPAIISKIAPAI
jgi:hypothetical protein